MKVPISITVITGETEKVHGEINKFFLKVKSEIEKKVGISNVPTKFRLERLNLCEVTPSSPQETDNYAHLLFYKERIVASVIETRTENNYVHFDYFVNITKLLKTH